jgi:acetolactate synthase small subunit
MQIVEWWKRWWGSARRPSSIEVKNTFETISYICAAGTLIIVAVQLNRDAKDRKVTKSLEVISQFSSEPLANHVLVLREFDQAYQNDLSQMQAGVTEEDKTIWVDARLVDFTQKHPDRQIEVSIRKIAEFFDQVESCEAQEICDAGTLRQFLRDEAFDVHCTFGHVIDRQAKQFNRPALGRGLAQLSAGKSCVTG